MIKDIYLVHHSHTDVGYTHPQPTVFELHRRFIDLALDYADETQDWPFESRFRWTCEVTGITLDWWQNADRAARARFLEAVARGQFEVAGAAWNMTPLMDHAMLLDVFKQAEFFRALGIPVRSAMNSDVNGWPWGAVDAMLDHGISGFSMAVNPHFGFPPLPRPRGFWWEGQSGRKLLVYNGLQYGVGAEEILRIPASMEEARLAVPAYAAELERRGHEQSFVMMQITNPIMWDNAGPRKVIAKFVRDWNALNPDIRLHLATLSQVFESLRAEPEEVIPTLSGDWSDWWNFGAGSSALETTLCLEGQRALRESQQLRIWPGADLPRHNKLQGDANQALQLYAEHTWGADRSIFKPLSVETRIQQGLKQKTAYEGASIARMLRRDGLERVARFAGGEEPTALIYNPLPYPVKRTIRIPRMDENLEPFSTPEPQAIQRQDTILGDLTDPVPPGFWHGKVEAQWAAVDLPALGFVCMPYASLAPAAGVLHANESGIGNERIAIEIDLKRGGISSFKLDGIEYARPEVWNFAQPVLEWPETGDRHEIFSKPDWKQPERLQDHWNPAWQAVREGPERVAVNRHLLDDGCAEFVQEMHMSNGDRITNHYRLFPGEANLEIETLIVMKGQADPHGLYLAFPVQVAPSAACHFLTAGAVVELGREQLPNTSQHFLTAQQFIRLQDAERGLSVACPDTPLWQAGGFTFGRHTNGAVRRNEAMLLAWLSNNYWDTNFVADQTGQSRQRFRVIPHASQPLEASIKQSLPYASSPQLHYFKDRGEVRHTAARLLDLELDGAILTGIENDKGRVELRLLNPADTPRSIRIRPALVKFEVARAMSLSGELGPDIPVNDDEMIFNLPPRAWMGLALSPARPG